MRPGYGGAGARLARLGAPIFGYFVASLVLRSVDRLALARYGNAHQLGLYGVALMASGLVLFVPEAAGYVLFPRVAAAYHGAVDRARVRADVVRVQRALAVMMPLLVGLAIVWAGPMVEWLLPGYRPAILALRLLAAGALALSAATVPGYFLLGCGRQISLLVLGIVAAGINAALVFGVASREPDPARVALAAAAGYALFALLILVRAGAELGDTAAARTRFVVASLAPAAWASALAFALVRYLPGQGVVWGFVASDLLVLGYLPVLLAMARGLGLRTLVREVLAARAGGS
jgi:O-antigen/teichoic acid export membrane protein